MTSLKHQTHYSLFSVKQIFLLYYKQADQQSLDLVQVKAPDIRAFLASKGFGGSNHASLSLEGAQYFHKFLPKNLV